LLKAKFKAYSNKHTLLKIRLLRKLAKQSIEFTFILDVYPYRLVTYVRDPKEVSIKL